MRLGLAMLTHEAEFQAVAIGPFFEHYSFWSKVRRMTVLAVSDSRDILIFYFLHVSLFSIHSVALLRHPNAGGWPMCQGGRYRCPA